MQEKCVLTLKISGKGLVGWTRMMRAAQTSRRSMEMFPPSTSSLNNLVRATSLRSNVLATHFRASFDASGVVASLVVSVIRHFRFRADARTWAP